ncbi:MULTISPECIES: ATP synthase subunit C [unclassified Desulfurobacterium]|uniref:ATP synthase subunit C n=1 Tax=Desulfurobacterium sp. TC5-1 TaxID=1158318 RepID=UPI0003B6C41C|nr:ATP synthase subunit C [Desulfurobacterium sp. TC5-1]
MRRTAFRTILLVMFPVIAVAGDAMWAYISAAVSVACSTIAAGAAVGLVGSAAMGAIGEKPEISGKAIVFLGLAEGIAIYGLIIAILILGKVG